MRALDRLLAPLVSDEARSNVLWATFFAGLLTRLWFAHVHPVGDFITSDMWVYDFRAGHLVDRAANAWDTFTPVGYPALLALVYRLFGKAYQTVGALNAVMGAATCVLTNLVAKRVTGSAKVALVAGAWVTVYPPLVLYCGFLLTETPSAFLLVLAVWSILRAADEPAWPRIAIAGVVFSIAVSVRPNFLLGLPAIAWFAWARLGHDRRETAGFVGRLLAWTLPVLLTVCVHNSRILGRPTGLGTNGGLNFYLAHAHVSGAAYADGAYTHRIIPIPNMNRYPKSGPFVSPVPFYEEAFFYRRGLAEFAARPREIAAALDNVVEGFGLGAQGFWPGWRDHDEQLSIVAKAFFFVGIFPALVWGAVLAVRRRLGERENAGRALLWGLGLSAIVTLYVFLGDPRVRVPFDPLFIVLAVDAIGQMVTRVSTKRGVT